VLLVCLHSHLSKSYPYCLIPHRNPGYVLIWRWSTATEKRKKNRCTCWLVVAKPIPKVCKFHGNHHLASIFISLLRITSSWSCISVGKWLHVATNSHIRLYITGVHPSQWTIHGFQTHIDWYVHPSTHYHVLDLYRFVWLANMINSGWVYTAYTMSPLAMLFSNNRPYPTYPLWPCGE
jgi:hypothetical protein